MEASKIVAQATAQHEFTWTVISGCVSLACLGLLGHLLFTRAHLFPVGWLSIYFNQQAPAFARYLPFGMLSSSIMFFMWGLAGLVIRAAESEASRFFAVVLLVGSVAPMLLTFKTAVLGPTDRAKPEWLRKEEERRAQEADEQSINDGGDERDASSVRMLEAQEYSGDGSRRVKIAGVLPHPILAMVNSQPGNDLEIILRFTRYGRGQKLANLPAEHSGRTVVVLDDEEATGGRGQLAVRHLQIKTRGRWTMTLGGRELTRKLVTSLTGKGNDILSYSGPSTTASVAWHGEGEFWLSMRDRRLTSHLRRGVLGWRPHRIIASSVPGTQIIELPNGAVLQVGGSGHMEWTVDVRE